MAAIERIRNFAIIAHIDHGKSTLADRLIQAAGAVAERNMQAQLLDNMALERERGITIKAQTVRLTWRAEDGEDYVLNLMDTPGHVDFSYEVSRSLAACEGAILVVDASQGAEAQTLANLYQALEANLEILPVLNKIDLPAAEPPMVRRQLEELTGLDMAQALEVSAKSGQGIAALLQAVVERLPPPKGDADAPLTALLVDSWYDSYLGVVVLVRVMAGQLKLRQKIRMLATDTSWEVEQLGTFCPERRAADVLGPGEIGYVSASIKSVADCRVGDTIVADGAPAARPLPGFRAAQQVVFCGLFPVDAADFDALRTAMGKLSLNDSSFTFEAESSSALGFGFRCGFLGLLHLEIVRTRLEREYGLDLIATAPSVVYHLYAPDGTRRLLHNPADMPPPHQIARMDEPWIEATILVPQPWLGAVLQLCEARRGEQRQFSQSGERALLVYDLPLNEVVFDFYDRLQSCTRGMASLDWQPKAYREGDLVRLQLLVNGEAVDALSMIVPRHAAEARGRALCEKLKTLIPRHLFRIPIQAAIGGKIIARETIAALRKDVTAKCYGGDVTRKRKLLEKQKAGKKKMRQFGSVEIPQSAFIAALKMD